MMCMLALLSLLTLYAPSVWASGFEFPWRSITIWMRSIAQEQTVVDYPRLMIRTRVEAAWPGAPVAFVCVCTRVCDLLRILLRKSSQVCTLTRIQCCIRSHADPTSAGTSRACITAHMLAPRAPGENSLCFAFHCFTAFIFRGAYSTVTHIEIDCMAPNTIFLHLKPSEDIFMVFYRDEHH